LNKRKSATLKKLRRCQSKRTTQSGLRYRANKHQTGQTRNIPRAYSLCRPNFKPSSKHGRPCRNISARQ